MAKTFRIDDEVREVLRLAIIDGLRVKIKGQLDRKLYERVNKVLTAAGGKWNKKAGAHIFTSDPRPLLGLAIETGTARNLQQESQQFFTPPDLAARMVDAAQIEPGQTVLEPSTGTGNIVKAIIDAVDTEIVGYETALSLCSHLDRTFPSYRLHTTCADFLEVTEGQGCFPRIVMNPPFENGSDIKHILHAITFLAPGGRLVALCANGPRQQEKLKPLADEWIPLPAGSFKESGTNANVAMMVYNKPRSD